MRRLAVLLLGLLVAGCAGMDAAMEYREVSPVHFHYANATWRIFDKPAEARLMITPTLGRALGEGVLTGLTFGAADTDIPKSEYQRAVEGWLLRTRRRCMVLDGYKLIRPQWEFKYRCY